LFKKKKKRGKRKGEERMETYILVETVKVS
jgi:hypothetical protein